MQRAEREPEEGGRARVAAHDDPQLFLGGNEGQLAHSQIIGWLWVIAEDFPRCGIASLLGTFRAFEGLFSELCEDSVAMKNRP